MEIEAASASPWTVASGVTCFNPAQFSVQSTLQTASLQFLSQY